MTGPTGKKIKKKSETETKFPGVIPQSSKSKRLLSMELTFEGAYFWYRESVSREQNKTSHYLTIHIIIKWITKHRIY